MLGWGNLKNKRQARICEPFLHEKNGFITATKSGTTNKYFVAVTKNFAAATKRFLIELNILLL